ncbi:gamma-glutamyl-gamma-aminobutyrate hydrolase family protein [Dactylosporangium aurantiacum]|uniref:Gamma-glutamyl-gamma-aminobutyrate hydrolase family protein n=1 Tax=Dactylosporangium aurantiacum TaxID=35754 RepID=A0A9Q9MNX0_9ACTN|nr:gamma-glutamyl-gamma-aminobutyrate hydrolase family protein [Dactylosporangium aurantiacum]MDG6104496.1 gamma-glutamyl-gamma-aminobutyrate hydrolase family protein [Dactylosporangium aurantiacum]UWZ56112.1 gamma-glutamyl-gamma-aminobutyrate hydrolase family protein [Dactylosporangium aurantiacum]
MTPVVGITAYVEPARWGVWDTRAVLVPEGYVRMVREAGARPVVLPPSPDDATDLVRRLDGLVLAGGADIEPAHYGAPAHPRTMTRPDRDSGELAVLAAALDADLPVLGVCRGMELLAVACGGTLTQHLPDVLGNERHQPAPGVYGAHPARFAPGSRAAEIFGPVAEINSYHHQAVDDPGTLTVTGWADDDVIEAVELPARRFVLGVQWHPEEAADVRPFAALVRAVSG